MVLVEGEVRRGSMSCDEEEKVDGVKAEEEVE